MPVTWTRGSEDEFKNIGDRLKLKVYKAAAEAMEVTIQAAVLNAKEMTATRPSAKSGRSGRVDTAAMLEAIMGDVRAGADEIVGRFGFINKQELYFKLQTVTGFMNGDFIEPTFALFDSKVIAEQDLLAALKSEFGSL